MTTTNQDLIRNLTIIEDLTHWIYVTGPSASKLVDSPYRAEIQDMVDNFRLRLPMMDDDNQYMYANQMQVVVTLLMSKNINDTFLFIEPVLHAALKECKGAYTD